MRDEQEHEHGQACGPLLEAAAAREEALRSRVRELEAAAPRKPFDVRCADALADEVAALVLRRVIDSRSPAADALLDYREPPSTPRADRIAALESRVLAIVGELWSARQAGDLRDVAQRLREHLFPRTHELDLRRDTAAALRVLKVRGVVGYLRGRGWFPA
jgi:hypothetical protein